MNEKLARIHIVDLDNILHVGTKSSKLGVFNVNGFPTGGFYKLCSLLDATSVLKFPEHYKIVFVYDTGEPYRKKIYPEYKSKRKKYKTDKDLTLDKAVQLQKELAIQLLNQANIPVIGLDGMEADDLMFNILLNIVANPQTPWSNGFKLVVHSSDDDWLGTLGFSESIEFNVTNSNSNRMNNIKNFTDYFREEGNTPYLHYIKKAIYGDDSDCYNGCDKYSILQLDEVKNGLDINTYWNYFHWEEVLKGNGMGDENTLLQFRLAFPWYHQDVFNKDWLNIIGDKLVDKNLLKDFLTLFRINSLKKYVGPLKSFTQEDLDGLEFLKSKYNHKYSEVFEYFEKIKYRPKISIEDANKAFKAK